MPTATEIFLNYVCPSIGVVIAILVWTAPIQSVKKAVKNGSIGILNTTPWALMTGNTIGWVAFSFVIKDPFVLLGNVPGVIISVWLNMSASKLLYLDHASQSIRNSIIHVLNNGENGRPIGSNFSDSQRPNRMNWFHDIWEKSVKLVTLEKAPCKHENLLVGVVTFWLFLLSIVNFVPMSQKAKELTIGISANFNLMFFFAAPLATMVTVVKTRDSSSIHIRTMVMNSLCSLFWSAYGIGIRNEIILVPNVIGVVFGLMQIFLCLIFPRKGERYVDEETPQDLTLSEQLIASETNHRNELL
mmetsp:Transcript_33243/g.48843  ORF Transcript_33243/g.48843 Transcript_33243/m.48843 type:complete len:301 (+) Transcript_33243:135-1037(+)|eukprot:CAMPEP_0195520508 /NCGR_PEP_ID=MMETSP0794_2-20130614/17069_1 /TAXON_ID=515487 /ORGANISM="Stephanopyxis turris, Strain CCMP 815" /LENGTH=300 /DNA_ID=CAMNT_0040649885 /DNA_START=122 /DNA_END=1024 /DNA_ORIENTATION=-